MAKETEKIINVERVEDLISVFGSFDENTKRIEESLNVVIINRGNELKISGDEENVDRASRALEGLLTLASRGETIEQACQVHGTDCDELVAKLNAYFENK